MKKRCILILGTGRSSRALISYLLERAEQGHWYVLAADRFETVARDSIGDSPYGEPLEFNLDNIEESRTTVQRADVVISLLPPHLHPHVARLCLEYEKHLFTASYVSEEMLAMHKEAKSKALLFMNECGLDPGLDHMGIMEVIDRIREKGGELLSLQSFSGGIIAPETDPENPWRYKFTWSPMGVIKAGQEAIKFLEEGKHKYLSYSSVFKRTTPIHIPQYGDFVGYANRDSLKYIQLYGLNGIRTLLRGTLRMKGFCASWDILAQLGCTDDTYQMQGVDTMRHCDFINSFLPYNPVQTVEKNLSDVLGIDVEDSRIDFIRWLDLFEKEKIGLQKGTPAQVLEHILNKKWALKPDDKDMTVMWNRFVYAYNGQKKEIQTSFINKGEDSLHTAMAKGVGLPLAMVTELFLQGKIDQRGVCVPLTKNIYLPVLEALRAFNVQMHETEGVLST